MNKVRLAITGQKTAPKLFSSLQLAYGLCGSWSKIIVIGSADSDSRYQYAGDYHTLGIARDAPPQRYMELISIAASCGKDVVIMSSFSDQWQYGVAGHLHSSYYSDVLRSHQFFLHALKQVPVHVIVLMDTRSVYLQRDGEGKRRLHQEQVIQQPDIADHFTTVLHLDGRGLGLVQKDGTKILPIDDRFKLTLQHGSLLSGWCRGGDPVISLELQHRIDRCTNLAELYSLLFELDIDDMDVISAFTRRRLQLDEERKEPTLEIVPGRLL